MFKYLSSFTPKVCIMLAMLAASSTALPTSDSTSQLESLPGLNMPAPHNTPWAKFWQETGDWRNHSTIETSLDKRIGLPDGRSQFVSWQNVGGGTGSVGNYIISLAVVVYTTGGPQRCNQLWDGLKTSSAVASAISANAIDVIRNEGWANAFPSALPAYYTYNYYGSMVVVAKLYFDNYQERTIRFMAGSLSGAWGLGDVVSNFTPANTKRSALRSTNGGQAFPQGAGAIISSASFTQSETGRLLDIVSSLSINSSNETESASSLQKRGNNCYNQDLTGCRNSGWTPWNTGYDYTCPPKAY